MEKKEEKKFEHSIFRYKDGRQYWISCRDYHKILKEYADSKGRCKLTEVYVEIAKKEHMLRTGENIEIFPKSDQVSLVKKRANGHVSFNNEYQENYYIEAALQVVPGLEFRDLCSPFYSLGNMSDFELRYPLYGEDTNDYSDLIGFINSDERVRLRNEIRTNIKEDQER